MGRLIDADALKTRVAEETKIAEGLGVEMAVLAQTMRDCIYEELENSPTIDAIPVDWMVQRMNETSGGSGMNVELNNALFAVGVEWERWKNSMAKMEADE